MPYPYTPVHENAHGTYNTIWKHDYPRQAQYTYVHTYVLMHFLHIYTANATKDTSYHALLNNHCILSTAGGVSNTSTADTAPSTSTIRIPVHTH